MSGINDSNATDDFDQAQIVLRGGTDNTAIGNVGDRAKVSAETKGHLQTSFSPDPTNVDTEELDSVRLDSGKNLITRSSVHCDEGSFRTDFNNALSSNLTGNVTFVNGSNIVTGVGTAFASEVNAGDYVKLNSDGTIYFQQVDHIVSDTVLSLYDNYVGASGSGTANISEWKYYSTGTGSSVSVASSFITLNAGTANGGKAYIEKIIDYLPLVCYTDLSIAVRQANQEVMFGFVDDVDNPTKEASIVFDGTNNTTLKFRTRSGASATQETTITLGGSMRTTDELDYEINILAGKAVLVIEQKVRAVHTDRIPFPYDVLKYVMKVSNTAAVASNNFVSDVAYISNVNLINVTNAFYGDTIKVEIVDPETSFNPKSGFIDGYVQTAATTLAAVRSTTYTEQTTNSQRSFKSSSASDAAAGVGARTILLTYYDQNMVGPFYETITLNGTTAVNTVATDICFVESIDVVTVGSTGTAVGIISLYTTTAGGGSVFASIAAGAVKSFMSHHYVAGGLTCKITSLTISTSGTVSGNGARFYLTSTAVLTPNAVNMQISENLTTPGAQPFTTRNYGTPIVVVGPSRITGWCIPNASATYINYLSYDYSEE